MRLALVALILAATPAAAAPTLTFLGTFVWERPEPYFGGWSAIEVLAGGESFVAIGDNGQVHRGRFERSGDMIVGIPRSVIGALADTDGVPFFRKNDGTPTDSEGLALLDGGRMAVSYERRHRVRIHDSNGRTREVMPLPGDMAENRGVEALAADAQERLIAIPEGVPRGAPGFPVWRHENGEWRTLFHITPLGGFRPVGADLGPDGALYVLERAFRGFGFQSRVRRFDLAASSAAGQVLWTSRAGVFDNLEGLSVWVDAAGRTRLTMISDDNHFSLQETQVVEFVLTR